VEKLQSELRIFYLDDGLLGGSAHDVVRDISLVKDEAASLGLQLNLRKSELIAIHPEESLVLGSAPELIPVHLDDAVFLGAPIGTDESIDAAISGRCDDLRVMGDRLPHFKRHDSLLLLRYSFAILYLLRTSPCFRSPKLEDFNVLLRSITIKVVNINLDDETVWLQASLPVSSGGLGVRSAVQLAPSAFLASAAGCLALTKKILPPLLQSTTLLGVEGLWKSRTPDAPPSSLSDTQQEAWDSPQVR
jgi:hypothetical protein